jgi:uncharacterized membrane protein
MEEKNLQLERTVFFCDAVVAIAITLLVFNLKIDHISGAHLTFKDILAPWKSFVAFLLSFLNIAGFWKQHHSFFSHIKKIDEKLLWFNIFWLFFIVTLPFTTSLVSTWFFDAPAVFVYSLNTFFITIFQNTIWDYAANQPTYVQDETSNKAFTNRARLYCNLDMLNAMVAVIFSFISPAIAFTLLFTKLPLIIMARIYLSRRNKDKYGFPVNQKNAGR